MDMKKFNDYIVTLDTEELLSRYKNEEGKWNEVCVKLCYLELAKRGALEIKDDSTDNTVRLDIRSYEEWIQDEYYKKGDRALSKEDYFEAKTAFEVASSRSNAPALIQLALLYYNGNGCE